jgi:hypothetical protein
MVVFLNFPIFGFSQSSDLVFLRGKIISANKEVKNVNVINLRSQNSIITDDNGNYSMFVKIGDTLQFSSWQTRTKKHVIVETDLSKKLFVLNLEPQAIPLDEVKIIDYKNINAVSLGILEKPAKKYTTAERKLKVAKDFDVGFYEIMVPNIFFSIDPIINAISGRTAALKKDLEIERKQAVIKNIEMLYNDAFFIEKLNIPSDYVKGFLFYVSDDEELKKVLATKNKTKIEFVLIKLSNSYLQISGQ